MSPVSGSATFSFCPGRSTGSDPSCAPRTERSTRCAHPLSTTMSSESRTRKRGTRRVLTTSARAAGATTAAATTGFDACDPRPPPDDGVTPCAPAARGAVIQRPSCSTSSRIDLAIFSCSMRSRNAAPDGVCASAASTATTLGRYARTLSIADPRLAEGNGIMRPGSDAVSRIAAMLPGSAMTIEMSDDAIAACVATAVPRGGAISRADFGRDRGALRTEFARRKCTAMPISSSLGQSRRGCRSVTMRLMPSHAVLATVADQPGALHDLTRVLAAHQANISYVDIIRHRDRDPQIYVEFSTEQPLDPLVAEMRALGAVNAVDPTASFAKIYGKRIVIMGGGAQVGQVALGAIAEADRHNIRGERISVDTIPLVGEQNLAAAVRAVVLLPRVPLLVLAGALMAGDITKAVEEVRAQGLRVISLNMAGSVPDAADLVVSDPVQAGVMAVVVIADTARFDILRQEKRRY